MIELLHVSDADYTFLHTLFLEIKGDEFLFLPQEHRIPLLTQQFTFQQQSYSLQYPEHEHFIIIFHNQKVGQLRIHRSEHSIRLIDISIHKQFQHQGIGTAILKQLQQEARLNSTYVVLQVFNMNEAAKQLYNKLGFKTIELQEPYVLMEWNEKL